jgi:hypothetical protein
MVDWMVTLDARLSEIEKRLDIVEKKERRKCV